MDREKLLIGKIDYINASPVYYGLVNGLVPDWITMIEGPPAVLNGMIKNGEIDISPVSSAFYAMNHKELLILPDLSISSHGEVLSVILMTNYPIKELDQKLIVLSQDSATSSALVKLIAIQNGVTPNFTTKRLRTLQDVPDSADAAMVIGDAAMSQPWKNRFKYRIDLGRLWYETTGLPFVFALWVVRREAAILRYNDVKAALELFYRSREQGYTNIDKVIAAGSNTIGMDKSYVSRYFELLHCNLDAIKLKALNYFFSSLYENSLLPEKVEKIELLI
ncbi:MAG: menaquinone biosynthesis protein [Desulfamplus sp.]|nr:menaquinone biosynthesis protein [Desulfamplus sp.]MBF0388515.1 menaquinone biosynthesis protein [Desulfamplus sp.]